MVNLICIYYMLQLVSNALQFLATVADRAQYRHLFEDSTVLSNICEKVIIPNMEFRGNHAYSTNMIINKYILMIIIKY